MVSQFNKRYDITSYYRYNIYQIELRVIQMLVVSVPVPLLTILWCIESHMNFLIWHDIYKLWRYAHLYSDLALSTNELGDTKKIP